MSYHAWVQNCKIDDAIRQMEIKYYYYILYQTDQRTWLWIWSKQPYSVTDSITPWLSPEWLGSFSDKTVSWPKHAHPWKQDPQRNKIHKRTERHVQVSLLEYSPIRAVAFLRSGSLEGDSETEIYLQGGLLGVSWRSVTVGDWGNQDWAARQVEPQ